VRFNLVGNIKRDVETAFNKARAAPDFEAVLGEVYGELAFNHPFLDGNGRSLNTVFSEVCRRAGFDLAWERMDRARYLQCLTLAVHAAEYGDLQAFLAQHVVRPLREPHETVVALTSIGKR